MSKNILKRSIIILPLFLAGISAQDQVDAIEAARQAKAAAEKAAADAEAATGAAIEAAAAKAAKAAREKVKQDKLDEEARKRAEADAAEAAELDAAAAAAAEEAKRKMAEELGLEYEAPGPNSGETTGDESVPKEVSVLGEEVEEVVAKEKLGFDVGLTGSVGFINGDYVTNTPNGGSLVIRTPYGFNGGNFRFNGTIAIGSYGLQTNSDGFGEDEDLDALFVGFGINATILKFVFSETHVGIVGAGLGLRNFSGVSLERILGKSLNLPVNILIGGEGFIATKADDINENSTYWGGLGLRLDYSF